MFDDSSILIESLKHPMNIASMALTEIENRLNGTKIIADPNTPFCHLLEFGSSINAATIQAIDEKLPVIYPHRAESMEDLYHHMSDFDYLRMYSTPSNTALRLTLPKKYLIENALPFNANYKKVTIPKDTIFMIGKYSFGMYYPIDILINNYTNTFTAVYDTTISNPLFQLTKNVVDKYDTSLRGIDYIILDFPIYQFSKSVVEKSAVAEKGFAEKFIYNNKFYAVRIFSYSDGVYTELSQSQSFVVYDAVKPTALVRVLPDEQKIKISIPQIYFDNNQIGSKLYIELYATLGELDIDTASISAESIQVNFSTKSKDTTAFSNIFKQLPFDSIMQLSSNKISGGTNAIDVDTLRNRVVSDSLYDKAPITADDLAVYLEDNGFYLKKYKDNITDRIFHAYRVLEDSTGAVIPSLTTKMRVHTSYVDTVSTFRLQSDDSITILPTTIYELNSETDDVTPLNNETMKKIAEMDKVELVEMLNSKQYFKTPFHLRVNLAENIPYTTSFNLMTPSIKKMMFVAENYEVAAKMTAFDAKVTHLSDGIGGYKVQLSIYKSEELRNIPEDYLKIHAMVKTSNGYWIGTDCTFEMNSGERDIYYFNVDTNYHLTTQNEIGITNLQNETIILAEHLVSLESDFYLVFLVDKKVLEGTSYQDASYSVSEGVPSSYFENFVAISRQYCTISLGTSLDDVIKNDMETSSTQKVYAVWDHDVPAVYTEDVYARNENGVPITEPTEDGGIRLVKLYNAGDPKLDSNGLPTYLHRKGDIRFDAAGNPMVVVDRDKIYYVDVMFIDAKVFASERASEIEFVASIYDTLEKYFTTVRNLQLQLMERTQIFFRCVRSTGTAKFNMGDGIVSKQNIEMSFNIICYVPSFVKKDETIQKSIVDKTCIAIEESIKTKVISMMDIFEIVKSKMSDYIDHFSLLGINGSMTNQTFVIMSEDAQPSIARKLELTEDNIISLSKQIQMEFVALEDNTSETVSVSV